MSNTAPICANGGERLELCIYWYLFNTISDGLFVIEWSDDHVPGRILEVNNVICDMLGYERDELLTHESAEFCPIRETCSKRSFLDALFTDKSVNFEVCMKRKNGSEFTAELSITRMFSHGYEAIVAVVRDLTSKRQIDEERYRKERFMGALTMAGATCHELNQPLQAIVGYLDLLHRTASNDAERLKWVRLIQEQIDRISAITRKLNNLTRYEEQEYIQGTKIVDLERSVS